MSSAPKLITWDELISKVCSFVGDTSSNVFNEKQVPMVESRLKRRMSELKISEPYEYLHYWNDNREQEDKHLIGLLTTHFTSFFREFLHFEWISKNLPALVADVKSAGRQSLRIWSAACSTGQEVWSMAMWMDNQMREQNLSFPWEIYGSDIDGNSVKVAENGVYHRRELATAPRHLWEPHWVQGNGDLSDWYKVKSHLRKHVTFSVDNLVNLKLAQTQKFDLIMCRNVLIYFDKVAQTKSVNGLLSHLYPSGVLITGLSESLTGADYDLKSQSPSIYRFKSFANPKSAVVTTPTPAAKHAVSNLPKPMRIFCVDDSPLILKLLKKILSTEEFTIVGTAANGQEALQKIGEFKPDAVTLDIHMPVMDGLTLIQNSDIAKTYPIVIVSSVQQDDDSIIKPLFSNGVKDFVEKPTLDNVDIIKDELAQKLKMAWVAKSGKNTASPSESHSKSAVQDHSKFHKLPDVFITVSENRLRDVLDFCAQSTFKEFPVTFILKNSSSSAQSTWRSYQSKLHKGSKITTEIEISFNDKNKLWIHTEGSSDKLIMKHHQKHDFVLVEESEQTNPTLVKMAFDVSPLTSMPYLVSKYAEGIK